MVEEYKTLGLNISASKEDIKKAYRKLSLLYHPDMPSGNQEKFIKVKAAYEALIEFDPNKTHNIHVENKKARVSVCTPYYDSVDKEYGLHIKFYGLYFADTRVFHGRSLNYSLFHKTEGNIIIPEDFLVRCKFGFEMTFHALGDYPIRKKIHFADRRKWYKRWYQDTLLKFGLF